ncbi:MAG: nitronate monooxygenase, partial [Pseudomonas fluorescens]|nr:nitronate monooxygenase [Pseudomonas fluorescens]
MSAALPLDNDTQGWREAQALTSLAQDGGLRPLQLLGKTLVPVVQGGMGVGVSASGLAGAVARLGAVGTLSAVDLRRKHPDLMAQTEHLCKESDAKERINAANLVALDREIQRARATAQGRGLLAVNVMKAVSEYEAYVRQALASGIDAVVVGAGLPLDLPDLAKDYPRAALIPILSDARGVQLIVRKWEKKGRLPDAIVIEHPRLAGGHLGAAKVADLNDSRFDFDVVIPQVLEFFKTAGIEREIPLIAAGGIGCREDIIRLQSLGAAAVQLGTAFAVTAESDADLGFKQVLANARPEDIVEFVSVAGLPARA